VGRDAGTSPNADGHPGANPQPVSLGVPAEAVPWLPIKEPAIVKSALHFVRHKGCRLLVTVAPGSPGMANVPGIEYPSRD